MGTRILYCGGPGCGSIAKLCNNIALASQMIGISEALLLGTQLGMNPITLSTVMNVSTSKCWCSDMNNPHPMVAESIGRNTPASNQSYHSCYYNDTKISYYYNDMYYYY